MENAHDDFTAPDEQQCRTRVGSRVNDPARSRSSKAAAVKINDRDRDFDMTDFADLIAINLA